jgi:hypothetical protein
MVPSMLLPEQADGKVDTVQPLSDGQPQAWLTERHAGGTSAAEALAFFDARPAVAVQELEGRWRGTGLPTGHPWDGLLERLGWYGKAFAGAEGVDPLLFQLGDGRVRPLDPGLVPAGLVLRWPQLFHDRVLQALVRAVRPLIVTGRPRARLRSILHRGVVTAAMVYDQHPIIDYFRRIDPDTVLGLMEMRNMEQPFFFVLRRDGSELERP